MKERAGEKLDPAAWIQAEKMQPGRIQLLSCILSLKVTAFHHVITANCGCGLQRPPGLSAPQMLCTWMLLGAGLSEVHTRIEEC